MRTYYIGNSVLCGDLNGNKIHKREDTCICKADSLCFTIETNKILWRNYTPIKIKKKIQSCSWKIKKNILIASLGEIFLEFKKKIERKSFLGLFLRTREAVKDCKVIPTKQPVDKCGVATVSQPCVCSRLRVPTWLMENVFSCLRLFFTHTLKEQQLGVLTF